METSPKWDTMLKTHKIALDPNNKQRAWFAQQCGYARFAYNHVLADFKSALDSDEFLSTAKLNERFNVAKKECVDKITRSSCRKQKHLCESLRCDCELGW